MQRWTAATAGTLTLMVAMSAGPGIGPAWAETPDQARRIANGEVVTWVEDSGQALKTCVAIGLIDAPPDKVYRAMTDYPNYTRVFHILHSVTVLKNDGSDVTCRFTMQPPWPFTERYMTSRNHLDPSRRTLSYRRLDGNIKVYEGQMSAAPWGTNRTKFTYRTRIDPGIPLLPAWAITWGTRTSLPGVVRDVGNYAKSLR